MGRDISLTRGNAPLEGRLMFLYIHGFLSSSQSNKAQQFRQWLIAQGREQEWACPDLQAPPN